MTECSQELEDATDEADLPNNHTGLTDSSDFSKGSDHNYSSSNADSDMMAWYCLGVA